MYQSGTKLFVECAIMVHKEGDKMYGQRLKEARKKKNLTLINVGIKLNTTHATISRYENEKLEPNLNTLKELCKIYNVSADYIIGNTNEYKTL